MVLGRFLERPVLVGRQEFMENGTGKFRGRPVLVRSNKYGNMALGNFRERPVLVGINTYTVQTLDPEDPVKSLNAIQIVISWVHRPFTGCADPCQKSCQLDSENPVRVLEYKPET